MARERESIYRRIDETASLAALWALMVRHFRARGFRALLYLPLDPARPGHPLAVFAHGMPPGLAEAYVALGGGRDDPMVRVALATGLPQVRSQIAERFPLTRDEAAHRAAMQSHGIGETLALPLFGPSGNDGICGLGQPVDETIVPSARLDLLHMTAQAAHLRAFALRQGIARANLGLSRREIEILRGVARGRSNIAIAKALALSPATVDTYLRRIFEKLDVADRTAAAVKGLSLGLIRA